MTHVFLGDHLSYSARVLDAFVGVLKHRLLLGREEARRLTELDLNGRIGLAAAHELFKRAEHFGGDELVGLRAGARCTGGDADLLRYLMLTADTPRTALVVAERYLRLIGDAWSLSWHVEHSRACVWIESSVQLPDSAEEFILALLFRNPVFSAPWLRSDTRVYLRRPSPTNLEPFEALLGVRELEFRAEKLGFTFDEAMLDRKLATHDPRLFAVLHDTAECALRALPPTESWSDRVRVVVRDRLPTRDVGLTLVASRLGLHPRQLSRRVSREGITFHDLVNDVRKSYALQLMSRAEHSIAEVATLTGFKSTSPFHRAFQRWTGQTPSEFRRAARDQQLRSWPSRVREMKRPVSDLGLTPFHSPSSVAHGTPWESSRPTSAERPC
jgi:AraC-like DNA-binding protein